jgi:hypothetical protein
MPVVLATQEAEAGESRFKVSLGKKLVRPHFSQQAVVHFCHPGYLGGDGRIAVQGWLSKKAENSIESN